MFLRLDDALFAGPADEDLLDLAVIARATRRCGHALEVGVWKGKAFDVTQRSRFNAWASQSGRLGALWSRLTKLPPSPGAVTFGTVALSIEPSVATRRPCHTVTLQTAAVLLSGPLVLGLENARTDGAFLRECFSQPWKQQLDRWLGEGLLALSYTGGITELKVTLGSRSTAVEEWLRRLFLVDHDGSTAKRPSKDSEAVLSTALRAGWPDHARRFRRRCQESYIPELTLQRWSRGLAPGDVGKEYANKPVPARHHAKPPAALKNYFQRYSSTPLAPNASELASDSDASAEFNEIAEWIQRHI